jgi:hypothetical protein
VLEETAESTVTMAVVLVAGLYKEVGNVAAASSRSSMKESVLLVL